VSTALLIGNSDGIGLKVTEALIARGFDVVGISRSRSSIDHERYRHHVCEVQKPDYDFILGSVLKTHHPIDVCLYCVGIGELFEPSNMDKEAEIISVNFVGMVATAARVIPSMLEHQSGHFVGISSVADVLLSPQAPSYHASKAGFSAYLESLALALKGTGVMVSNIRFGFVDTKMAKGEVQPFKMTVERACEHVLRVIDKRPARYTAPRFVGPLVALRDFLLRRGL
jgi:short-subunit dehydrogenase